MATTKFFKEVLFELTNGEFIEILKRQNLNLDENDFDILKKTKISGQHYDKLR
jgi:hypothetical protein